MLRAPVLFNRIRLGQKAQKRIRKNISRKFSRGRGISGKGVAYRPSTGDDLKVKVSIEIHELVSGFKQKVFYKDDDDRFPQRHTLKLRNLSEYSVTMEVEPGVKIHNVKMGGAEVEDLDVINNPAEEDKTVLNFTWSTRTMLMTERKYRAVLPCVLLFEGYNNIKFEIMVKFYNFEETDHYVGLPLSSLTLQTLLSSDDDDKTKLCGVKYNEYIYK